jgi:rhodanese-related sulfurtransferase
MSTTYTQGATTPLTSVHEGTSMGAQATPREVRQWMQNGECMLIDVRDPDEHAREKIAGAVLMPLSRFDGQRVLELIKPGQKVVVHCRSGSRGSEACRLASSMSREGVDVVNLTGGIEAWKKDALPVELNITVSGVSVMRQVQIVIGVCVLIGSALTWLIDPRFIVVPAFFGAGLTFAGVSGTCALATVIGWMPWNRAKAGGASCASGSC